MAAIKCSALLLALFAALVVFVELTFPQPMVGPFPECDVGINLKIIIADDYGNGLWVDTSKLQLGVDMLRLQVLHGEMTLVKCTFGPAALCSCLNDKYVGQNIQGHHTLILMWLAVVGGYILLVAFVCCKHSDEE